MTEYVLGVSKSYQQFCANSVSGHEGNWGSNLLKPLLALPVL